VYRASGSTSSAVVPRPPIPAPSRTLDSGAVEQGEPRPGVADADAGRPLAVGRGRQPDAVVAHAQLEAAARRARRHGDDRLARHVAQAVAHRVLHEGLHAERRHARVAQRRRDVDVHAQALAHAEPLDGEVLLDELELLGQGDLVPRVAAQRRAQERAERQEGVGGARVLAVAHEGHGGVERVEDEVRAELRAERPELRLGEPPRQRVRLGRAGRRPRVLHLRRAGRHDGGVRDHARGREAQQHVRGQLAERDRPGASRRGHQPAEDGRGGECLRRARGQARGGVRREVRHDGAPRAGPVHREAVGKGEHGHGEQRPHLPRHREHDEDAPRRQPRRCGLERRERERHAEQRRDAPRHDQRPERPPRDRRLCRRPRGGGRVSGGGHGRRYGRRRATTDRSQHRPRRSHHRRSRVRGAARTVRA
jgi:hypothetical protein